MWLYVGGWAGPGPPDLDVCWSAYLRRFDIEHTYRFAKNTLGWTTPSLCTPEQADRWTWLIAGATHTMASPTRISLTARHHRHTGPPTEIRHARARTTQRHPKTAPNPLPGPQEDRLTTPAEV